MADRASAQQEGRPGDGDQPADDVAPAQPQKQAAAAAAGRTPDVAGDGNAPLPPDDDDDDAAAGYERAHVHAVYDAIADHFSATRHSPWPLVARFLAAQPPGSIGLDVGCGNGKYLLSSDGGQTFMLGCDRSPALAATAYARAAGRGGGRGSGGRHLADVVVADALALPFRAGGADFAVCVAVVHHLATRGRRQAAIAELLGCVQRGTAEKRGAGRVLLYVWALEQAASRRGWAAGGAQDLLVPWVKTTPGRRGAKKDKGGREDEDDNNNANDDTPATFHRYYHLYREGELEDDVAAAGGRVVAHGYEKDNWWVICDPA